MKLLLPSVQSNITKKKKTVGRKNIFDNIGKIILSIFKDNFPMTPLLL